MSAREDCSCIARGYHRRYFRVAKSAVSAKLMSNIFAVQSTRLLASFHGLLHSLPRSPDHVPHTVLIIHDEKDNVGVVVIETTKKGQVYSAWIMENDKTVKVPSRYSLKLI
mgnify:CR=1 FL=1